MPSLESASADFEGHPRLCSSSRCHDTEPLRGPLSPMLGHQCTFQMLKEKKKPKSKHKDTVGPHLSQGQDQTPTCWKSGASSKAVILNSWRNAVKAFQDAASSGKRGAWSAGHDVQQGTQQGAGFSRSRVSKETQQDITNPGTWGPHEPSWVQ